MLTENIPAGWEKEEKAEDMKGAISARELPRDGLTGLTLHSEKRDPNPIVREQAQKSGSRKRKSNQIVYHLIPLLALVIYKVSPGNGTKTA